MSPYLLMFATILVATSSVIVHATLPASTAPASVSSHSCSSTGSNTVKGTMTVTNADPTAVQSVTGTLGSTLTSSVQSSSTANSNAVVSVDGITPLANGDLEIAYTCSGVGDHPTCQSSLNTVAKSPAIQQTVSKCSQSSASNSKTTQKSATAAKVQNTEATTKKLQTEATTKKPQTEATTKKPETEATTKKPQTEATTKKPQTEASKTEPKSTQKAVTGNTEAKTSAQPSCNPQCQNGGTCTGQNSCTCNPGFIGAACEIQSTGLCSDTFSFVDTPIISVTFNAGTSQYSSATPAAFSFSTTYHQQFAPVTNDGQFSFVNSVHDDFGGAWHTGATDHTGDKGGYMFLVNADYTPDQFYNGTVNNLIIGKTYELSVYVANLMVVSGIEPNLLFQVRTPQPENRLLAQINSGNISSTPQLTWGKYGLSFTATTTSVTLLMISNAPGGYGNDLVIDDITFRVCQPPAPTSTAPASTSSAPAATFSSPVSTASSPASAASSPASTANSPATTASSPPAISSSAASTSTSSSQPTCSPQCQNGGKCTVNSTCICTHGFSGPTCAIQSSGLCSDTDSFVDTPILTITFNAGSAQYSNATPAAFDFSTTYQQEFAPVTNDGQFSFVNSVHDDFSGAWHTGATDHTGDKGGYMFLVNADYTPDQFYNGTVSNLIIGKTYELSVYVANLMVLPGIEPNLLFQVRTPQPQNTLLAEVSSGNISSTPQLTWGKYGLSFRATTTSVSLLIISNAPGGYGNDLVIDDITFRVCKPRVTYCTSVQATKKTTPLQSSTSTQVPVSPKGGQTTTKASTASTQQTIPSSQGPTNGSLNGEGSTPVHGSAPTPSSSPAPRSTPAHGSAPTLSSAPTPSSSPAPRSTPAHGSAPTLSSSPAPRSTPAHGSAPTLSSSPAPRSTPAHGSAPAPSNSSDVTFNGDSQYDSQCGLCALRYISSSFLIQGVTLEEIAQKLGRKFLQSFKELLIDEITKYHSKGLKSIKIISLATYDGDSLIIDFVTIVNPKYYQQISSAIRLALLSMNLELTFRHKHK